MRQLILLTAFIFFLTSCSTSSLKKELTAEEENKMVVDMAACKEKADASTRGFGQGGITWERKHKEIYDYCMRSKGWGFK
jgi:type III secretory pathway lipoprotein EscJ